MKYVYYIWDFDGTLFNTYPHMTRSFQKALADCGVFEPTGEEVLLQLKKSVSAAVRYYEAKYALEGKLAPLYSEHERHGDSGALVRPYDGALEVCRRIVEQGGQNFLYTHRDNSAMDYLEKFGMSAYFKGSITSMDHFPVKPAPNAILHLVKLFGLEKPRTLMVGDRDIDVEAGLKAGVSGCLFDPEEFYREYPAALRVKTMGEFADVFLV